MLLITLTFQSNEGFSQEGNETEWKNHTSTHHNLSIKYPSNWNLNEGQESRFDPYEDLSINYENPFAGESIRLEVSNPDMTSGPKQELEYWRDIYTNNDPSNPLFAKVIEDIQVNKYNFSDRVDSYSMLITPIRSIDDKPTFAIEQITTMYDDQGYEFMLYSKPAQFFDDPQISEIRERMISSIKLLSDNSSQSPPSNISELISTLTSPTVPSASALGKDDASLYIVEFGDYQDPFSARFNQETKADLISKYVDPGIVRFGFKDLIINDLPADKISTLGAEASYCAADQDKYWEYHDEVYRNSRGENAGWISQDSLIGFAKNVNITDIPEFTSCLESHKYNQLVVENDMFAKSLGLASTPTFLILKENSTRIAAVEGAQPLEVFDDVVNQQLNNTL